MEYSILTTPKFDKDIKAYHKKFKNVADDVKEITDELKNGNLIGNIIPNLEMKDNENNVVKVRIANSNTHSGKSNGYRLIYYAVKTDGTIYLLTMYYKKDKENISNKEIQELILKYCI
jgi:mRNA-degrading endonuclease RelE of RelBE toxin-antitoxin system